MPKTANSRPRDRDPRHLQPQARRAARTAKHTLGLVAPRSEIRVEGTRRLGVVWGNADHA